MRGTLSLQTGPSQDEIKKLALEGSLNSYATWWARKNLAFPDPRRDFDYAVQSWQLGDLTIVALEGEVCSDWGALARSLPVTKHSMTVGYANEVSCYIPTARIIQEGGYEGDQSHKVYMLPGRFDPKMEVELTALIQRAVAKVAGQPAPLEPVAFDRGRLRIRVCASARRCDAMRLCLCSARCGWPAAAAAAVSRRLAVRRRFYASSSLMTWPPNWESWRGSCARKCVPYERGVRRRMGSG